MCGIVGFYSNRNDKEKIINEQLKTLYHRGPDDQKVYIDKNIATYMAFIRPTVKLSSRTMFKSGKGSEKDPYIIR